MAHYEGKRFVCSCPDGTCDMNCRMYRIAEGKPSKADLIRAMTDDELAKLLWDVWRHKDPFYKECIDGWAVPFCHWLKQEGE